MASSNIVSVGTVQDQILQYRYDPASIARVMFQTLSDVGDGTLALVDASNPLVYGLVMTAVGVSAAMQRNETLNRKQYPAMSQTLEDLYHHMSDTDYLNRFATPSKAVVRMYLPYTDVMNGLIADATTGDSRIVIPINTQFTCAGATFSTLYPIIIRKLTSGSLQVLYDTSTASPMQTLKTNVITSKLSQTAAGTIYLQFDIELLQFTAASVTKQVSPSGVFQYKLTYSDQFYYARVYTQSSDGTTWNEIQTTHSALVYDPNTVTAVLKVLDNNVLQVTIPQIYTANGQLTSTVRIDVYTTKGALALSLGDYLADQWSITYAALDKKDPSLSYMAPLKAFTQQIYASSSSTVNGGSNGKSFATQQQEVIDNSTGANLQPISRINVVDALADEGYTVVTDIDNVTDRQFLATRQLPDPTNSTLITAAGTTNATVTLSFDDIADRSYVIDHAADNHDALTILPSARYQDVNGVVGLVTDADLAALTALSIDQLALQITAGKYYYTPFHYVLNNSTLGLTVKPYYLDAPTQENQVFVDSNKYTQATVSTGSYSLTKTATGYQLVIVTNSDATFKALADNQIYVQLAVVPKGETDRAYINGVLMGLTAAGERQYSFDLSTNFYVDTDDYLALTKMFMYTTDARQTYVPLDATFDILYSTTAAQSPTWQKSTIDSLLGRFLLPTTIYALTQETVDLVFGTALDRLWAGSRSVVSSQTYQTYTQNIQSYYADDVYQIDPKTGSILTINSDGSATYTILHKKGDPVLNDDGTPVYVHKIGDVMLDSAGNPIVVQDRSLQHQIDFMLVEGVYIYATDSVSATYRAEMISTIVTWLSTDIETLAENLLENSSIWFYPKKTVGQAEVLYGQSQTATIDMGQSPNVKLYVSKATYNNSALRDTLSTTTVSTSSTNLNVAQVSRSAIQDALKTVYGTDVIDVEFSGLGGTLDLDVFTVLDDSLRPSLRKRLTAQSDGSLIVEEDVTIEFILHDVSSIS